MRRASVTIGTWLVLGAAAALVNCGGDDSTSPAGTGGSGGSGATGGSGGTTGGSGGSGGSTAGSGGSGMQDSGADQSSGGSAGAGGSAGKAGGSGAGGAAGKAGAAGSAGAAGAGKAGGSGAGGSAGGGQDSGTGGSAGSSMDASADANQCPAMQPPPASACAIEADCTYGMVICTCIDPGPNGTWACHGGPHDAGGGGDASQCPADEPTGEACPDAGLPIGPCIYGGNTSCSCRVGDTEWFCIRFTPAR
jgi:hypothetical protein